MESRTLSQSVRDGPETVHATFERESKLFLTTLMAAGRSRAFKGYMYSYHLWANLAVLFRRFGCLELLN